MTETMNQDEALMKLYQHLRSKPEAETVFVSLDGDGKREYMRRAQARTRQKKKASAAAGRPEVTKGTVRDVLADAAIMLLATKGPGSREIMVALDKFFGDRVGVPFTVESECHSGKLRPKLLMA